MKRDQRRQAEPPSGRTLLFCGLSSSSSLGNALAAGSALPIPVHDAIPDTPPVRLRDVAIPADRANTSGKSSGNFSGATSFHCVAICSGESTPGMPVVPVHFPQTVCGNKRKTFRCTTCGLPISTPGISLDRRSPLHEQSCPQFRFSGHREHWSSRIFLLSRSVCRLRGSPRIDMDRCGLLRLRASNQPLCPRYRQYVRNASTMPNTMPPISSTTIATKYDVDAWALLRPAISSRTPP